MSHWTFWVTSPRLDVRLWNSTVDNRASSPARSLARMCTKNQARNKAPTTTSTAIHARLLSASRIPMTTSTKPVADRTAPTVSKGRVGSGATGSSIRRLSNTIVATMSAWKTKAARQLMAVVMRPPISGPAAAPMPPIPLMIPNARARDRRSWNSIVVRM